MQLGDGLGRIGRKTSGLAFKAHGLVRVLWANQTGLILI